MILGIDARVAHFYFVLVEIFDFSISILGFLAEEQSLFEQEDVSFFAFSSKLLRIEHCERILQ